jgi:hypothetical protein
MRLRMIRNFADRKAEKTWVGTASRRLPVAIQQVARDGRVAVIVQDVSHAQT